MNLDQIIELAILDVATATAATAATHEPESQRTVATVATIAVAAEQKTGQSVANVATVAGTPDKADWYLEALEAGTVFVCHPKHVNTCGECQHFRRIEHPNLGKCSVGEQEGICGNWDTDPRNHCMSYESQHRGGGVLELFEQSKPNDRR